MRYSEPFAYVKSMKTVTESSQNTYHSPLESASKASIMLVVRRKGLDKDEEKHGRLIRQERYKGAMQRSFYVGDGLTEDDVKASFANGVLKISLPKAEAKKALPEERYIEIEG